MSHRADIAAYTHWSMYICMNTDEMEGDLDKKCGARGRDFYGYLHKKQLHIERKRGLSNGVI